MFECSSGFSKGLFVANKPDDSLTIGESVAACCGAAVVGVTVVGADAVVVVVVVAAVVVVVVDVVVVVCSVSLIGSCPGRAD